MRELPRKRSDEVTELLPRVAVPLAALAQLRARFVRRGECVAVGRLFA